jgi:hypothetical protein
MAGTEIGGDWSTVEFQSHAWCAVPSSAPTEFAVTLATERSLPVPTSGLWVNRVFGLEEIAKKGSFRFNPPGKIHAEATQRTELSGSPLSRTMASREQAPAFHAVLCGPAHFRLQTIFL